MSRLFFALWPDKQTRQSIVEVFSQLPAQKNARPMPPHNLHVTLHFVGNITDESRDKMHLAAQNINSSTFTLDLDCFGYFSKAKIFWMGCHKPPPVALLELYKDLGRALAECGYQFKPRFYTPHITLMRKCTSAEYIKLLAKNPHFSIPWMVNEFVLVESQMDQHGVNYRVIEHYPFS